MSVAAKTADGKIFIESIDCRPIREGNGWILAFLTRADTEKVVVDGANGQDLLAEGMKQAKLKAPILPTVKQIIMANAIFMQSLSARADSQVHSVCHRGQPSLMRAASNCEKRAIGSAGGFGFQSIQEGVEIGLLDSAILAYWACSEHKEKRKQKVRC